MAGFSRKIAFRYLWSKRSEAFITIITIISILGIAIGVMVLNIVMAVMTGFEHELREKIIGTDSHIVVRRLTDKLYGWHDIENVLDKVSGVESVSPYTYHQALLRVEGRHSGILIRGVEKGSAGALQLSNYLEQGESIDELFSPPKLPVFSPDSGKEELASLPGIVVGRSLARELGLLVGSPVSLLSPSVGSTPFGLAPKFRRFVVAGIYSSGLVEYENGLAYVSLPEAQQFFEMGDSVTGFEIRLPRDKVDNAPAVAQEIINKAGPLARGLIAEPWTERNKALWHALSLEKWVYFIVLLLIIVMASFSVVTTLIMIVLEKRKDIAIMRTMGATGRSVAGIFCTQGAVIGLFGTVAGLILGYLGCAGLQTFGFPLDESVFQMSTLPILIDPMNFLIVGIASLGISSLATLYPAWRASTLQPSDLLRYE